HTTTSHTDSLLTYTVYRFFITPPTEPLALHSFPTRRSSDLQASAAESRKVRPRGVRVPAREERIHGHALGVVPEDRDRGLEERRSEEHTSELQSRSDIVCRLLLEKKKIKTIAHLFYEDYLSN